MSKETITLKFIGENYTEDGSLKHEIVKEQPLVAQVLPRNYQKIEVELGTKIEIDSTIIIKNFLINSKYSLDNVQVLVKNKDKFKVVKHKTINDTTILYCRKLK